MLPVPDTMLSVAVHVGEITDDGADLVQLYARENGHRSREGVLLRRGREVATRGRPRLAGGRSRPSRPGAAPPRAGSCSPAASRPRTSREAIERVRPWAVDASSSLETEPGVKDHDRIRAYVEAARC